MWELMANGLNIAGSAASVYSFIKGFSVDRDLQEIMKRLPKIEELLYEIRDRPQCNVIILEKAAPIIADFSQFNNPGQTWHAAEQLERYATSPNTGLTQSERNILNEAASQMKKIALAYRYTESDPVLMPKSLLRDIIDNPSDLGLEHQQDITGGGLLGQPVKTGQRYILENSSPITWCNPLTGRSFVGEMPFSVLSQYGLEMEPPSYECSENGHIYALKSGQYSPLILGEMYFKGEGVKQNYEIAAKYYKNAASRGSRKAEAKLAVMYRHGLGVPQSDAAAMEWTIKASRPDARACYQLGLRYLYGQGVTMDREEAKKWFRVAVKGGNEAASAELRKMGLDVPIDDEP